MNRNLSLAALSLAAILLTAALPTQAQMVHTWVSGTGDDTNPCSRSAPCRTFAAALALTTSGGVISAADPGEYGGVVITQAVTISAEGFEADVLVSGTNGIVVAAGPSDIVILRGLNLEGLGTGLDGIRFLSGAALYVERCTINNFTNFALDFIPGAPSNPSPAALRLLVKDSVFHNNGSGSGGSGTTGGGVVVAPAAGYIAQAELSNVRLERNIMGVRSQSGANTKLYNCVADGNLFGGFNASSGGVLTVDHCSTSHNATGINCPTGSIVRIGNVTSSDNGTDVATGGTCITFKNNDIGTAGIAGLTTNVQQ
jgi:hypothetical protein